MPVLTETAVRNWFNVPNNASSAAVSALLNINPVAEDLIVIAGLLHICTKDISAEVFTAKFGEDNTDMTLLKTQFFNSNKAVLKTYKLDDPPTEAQSFTGAITSGIPANALTGTLSCVVAVASGYDSVATALTSDSVVTAGGTNTKNNSVVVPSLSPAARAFSIHAFSYVNNNYFESYNQVQRAQAIHVNSHLLLGDAPGDDSVTLTAVQHISTTLWAAAGFNLLPSVVHGNALAQIQAPVMSASGSVARVTPPSAERTWVLDPNKPREKQRFDHDLSAVLDYTIDWGPETVDDDYLVNVVFTTSDPALSVFSTNLYPDDIPPGMATVWLQGGVLNVPVDVVCHATWHSGRQDSRTMRVRGRRK